MIKKNIQAALESKKAANRMIKEQKKKIQDEIANAQKQALIDKQRQYERVKRQKEEAKVRLENSIKN
jgi:hypothetical protein